MTSVEVNETSAAGPITGRPGSSPGPAFTLHDRYDTERGEILATGVQALVRLPIDVMRWDRRRGLNTAAFISGYQGSPLGTYDSELQRQRKLLDEFHIVHNPGLNEELAATSVMGSQLSSTFASHRYDGVVGIWYGKNPGLDRACDAIRHGTFVGASSLGGVLALVGDDHAAKSSTLPSRCDVTLASLRMPVIYPGNIADVLELGMHGVALSRASGLWVGVKVVTPIADGSGTALVDPLGFAPVMPTMEVDGRPWQPTVSAALIPPASLALEQELATHRWDMAKLYLAANPLNQMVVHTPQAWLGIVAGGYGAEQVVEALRALGLSIEGAGELGIRMLKLRVTNPLDDAAVRELARETSHVLVVEDKLDFLETQVRSALYGITNPPAVLGKLDGEGRPLIPSAGTLTVDNLVEPLRRTLLLRVGSERLAPVANKVPFKLSLGPEATRTPFFCSGCPHNTSTKVPYGSLVGAGIGCHGMVSLMDNPSVGTITGLTQMGGEGAQWIGIAPFVGDRHLFQNLGDGTFFHSGQLAIQAAVAAGTTITYKLLYNAAVAMTGGQDAPGMRSVPEVTTILLAEGVRKIIITTDEPRKYRELKLPHGVDVLHRDKIIEAQEKLRAIDGVTVLIHDQQCAAEKRRDRKRGVLAPAPFRVMIDERVCEGCGDCGVQSNCLSLHPLETEFGRKTTIDQASCNIDASCLKGDCPAFITVTLPTGAFGSNEPVSGSGPRAGSQAGARARAGVCFGFGAGSGQGSRGDTSSFAASLPGPTFLRNDVTIRMPGIGGTGVVTASQMLATAAQIAGVDAHSIDQTGLSQKAGPVVSTLSLGHPVAGRIDVLLAFDPLVAVTQLNLTGLDPSASVAVVSTGIAPTGRMVGKPDKMGVDLAPIKAEIDSRTMPNRNRYLDAAHLTTGILGNAITENVFLVGVAYQDGFIPLPAGAIEKAIDLNGASVEANVAAFRWGRRWVVDRAAVEEAASVVEKASAAEEAKYHPGIDVGRFADPALAEFVAFRASDLIDYQSLSYAKRYLTLVHRCEEAERLAHGDGVFTRTVARQLHRLMAYKDEYEVARLLLEGRHRVTETFGDGARATWNLHPPTLRAMGMGRKLKMGEWTTPMLRALRRMKRLRNTPLDVFGKTDVRRTERVLIKEYVKLVEDMLVVLPTDPARATHVVGLIDQVKGFEHVKMANVGRYRERLAAEVGHSR